MSELFKTSEQTDKLDEALAKAQGEIEEALKDTSNPFYKSKYADLASITKACKAALSKYGVARSQWPVHSEDDRMHVITRLACAGQWIMSEWSMPISKLDPQGYVAALTYCRRGALAAACGVAPDDDDDGNHAAENHQASQRQEPKKNGKKQAPAGDPNEEEQLRIYNSAAKAMGAATTEARLDEIEQKAKEYGASDATKTKIADFKTARLVLLRSSGQIPAKSAKDFEGQIVLTGTLQQLAELHQEIANSGLSETDKTDLYAVCELQKDKIENAAEEPIPA